MVMPQTTMCFVYRPQQFQLLPTLVRNETSKHKTVMFPPPCLLQ